MQKFLVRYFVMAALSVCVLVLSSCGSSSNNQQTSTTSNFSGQVYTQSPQSGAVVTVKDANGNVLGVATTDSAGYYSMNLTSDGPFFAKAVTASGEILYGIGATDRLNITQLGSQITSLWFAVNGKTTAQAFDGLASTTAIPDPYEIESVAAAIMAAVDLPANEIPPYVSLLENEITGGFSTFLQQLAINASGGTSMSVSINGTTLPIIASLVNGAVQFTGFPFLDICPN